MRYKALPASLVVAAIVAVGCGSASAKSHAAKGSPIKLDLIADMDFPPAGISLQTARPDLAALAAIKAINRAGGVHGHPLKLTVCDSKGDGNIANACANAAVKNGSVADVGGFSFVGTPAEILNAGGVAMIGRSPGFTPGEFALPAMFPFFAVGETGMSDAVYAAVKFTHAKKIALISTPPADSLYFATGKAEAQALGATVTTTVDAAPGSDLTSTVLAAQNSGAQVIAAVTPIVDQVIVAARQNGVTLPIVSSLQPSQVHSIGSAGNGVWSIEPYQLPTASAPGLKQMNKELNAYQSTGIPRTVFTLPGWLAVHMFADVANKLKVVNRKTVLHAFQHLKNQYAYGLIPPYTTATKFKGLGGIAPDIYSPWVYIQQDENGKLVERNGGNPFNPFAS